MGPKAICLPVGSPTVSVTTSKSSFATSSSTASSKWAGAPLPNMPPETNFCGM